MAVFGLPCLGGVSIILLSALPMKPVQIWQSAPFCRWQMASKPDMSKTQHQRFVEAAKKLGADTDAETFRNIVRKFARRTP